MMLTLRFAVSCLLAGMVLATSPAAPVRAETQTTAADATTGEEEARRLARQTARLHMRSLLIEQRADRAEARLAAFLQAHPEHAELVLRVMRQTMAGELAAHRQNRRQRQAARQTTQIEAAADRRLVRPSVDTLLPEGAETIETTPTVNAQPAPTPAPLPNAIDPTLEIPRP